MALWAAKRDEDQGHEWQSKRLAPPPQGAEVNSILTPLQLLYIYREILVLVSSE
jgi:hypothetical protein